MADRHDDEIEHYRARVDAIPTPEATPELVAMSEARIEEFRMRAQDSRELLVTAEDGFGVVELGFEEVDELLDEIDRLRSDRDAAMRWYRETDDRWHRTQQEIARLHTVIAERDATIKRLENGFIQIEMMVLHSTAEDVDIFKQELLVACEQALRAISAAPELAMRAEGSEGS